MQLLTYVSQNFKSWLVRGRAAVLAGFAVALSETYRNL